VKITLRMKRELVRVAVGTCAAAILWHGTAGAQSYPVKPIRMVLPFAAGAPSDLVGRIIAQRMGEQMGQSIVADNRPGAGGTVGVAHVAKSAPDGYTILVTPPVVALGPLLYSNVGYNPMRDLVPIARLVTIENVMLIHPSVPARTLMEFVALVRARPGKLNYGSGGPGTSNHLANELLISLEKLKLVHIPYKGATLAAAGLMAGEVDELIIGVSSALPFIKAGKVRAVVVLSNKRDPVLPNVPSASEAGYPGFVMPSWYAMMAPAGTPPDVVNRLYMEVVRAFDDPTLKSQMATAAINPWLGSPEDVASVIRNETTRYEKVIQSAGLKIDAL
jgi:tripartite-type tricarboxylate transporter receptor subunit TctC